LEEAYPSSLAEIGVLLEGKEGCQNTCSWIAFAEISCNGVFLTLIDNVVVLHVVYDLISERFDIGLGFPLIVLMIA